MIDWLALIVLIPLVLVPVVLLYGFSGCDLVFQLELPPEPVFQKAFEIVLPQEGQRANRTVIVRIEPVRLFGSGPNVRITLQRPRNADLLINAMYISQPADSGDPYDAGADLTPVITGGLAVTMDPNGAALVLEPVAYNLDHTKPLLIAFDVSNAGNLPEAPNVPPIEMASFSGPRLTPPLHEAGIADRQTGYTVEPRFYLIQLIEVG